MLDRVVAHHVGDQDAAKQTPQHDDPSGAPMKRPVATTLAAGFGLLKKRGAPSLNRLARVGTYGGAGHDDREE